MSLVDAGRDAPVRRRVARATTELLAPGPIVAVLLIVIALHSTPSVLEALKWGILAALFASVVPIPFILRGVRRRALTDRHVRVREQRTVPLLVAMGSVVVGLILLAALGAPRDVVALVAAMLAGLAVCLGLTFKTKVSFHTAVAAGAVTILVLVFGPELLVLAPLLALLAWARVELRDHTTAQVVLGLFVGAAVAAIVFTALR